MKGAVIDDVAIVLSATDTVATALSDLESGRTIDLEDGSITLRESVAFGHKVALTSHEIGESVHKYGEVIGVATEQIPAGAWVHVHNVESRRGRGDKIANDSADSEGRTAADDGPAAVDGSGDRA